MYSIPVLNVSDFFFFFLKKSWQRTLVVENKIKLLELFCNFCILYSDLLLYLVNICL